MQVQMLLPTSHPSPSASHVPRTIPAHLPGPFSIVASILRTEGPRGLWLGHTGTLIRETGGSAAWFSTKEFVSAHLRRRRRRRSSAPDMSASLLPWESALSGACAGIVYNVVLFPADTIKSAIQTEEELRPRAKGVPGSTFLGMGMAMWRKQGFRGLYAGCGVTVARAAPSSAVIFLIYDGLKSRFG
jgi:mitochondrial ornithine carrier protein